MSGRQGPGAIAAGWLKLFAEQRRTAALMDAEEELLRLAEDPGLGTEYAAGLRLGASGMRRLRDSPVLWAVEPGLIEIADARPDGYGTTVVVSEALAVPRCCEACARPYRLNARGRFVCRHTPRCAYARELE